MRDEPVPCRHATLYETERVQHITWEDDGICKPCKRNIQRFIDRGAESETEVQISPHHPSVAANVDPNPPEA